MIRALLLSRARIAWREWTAWPGKAGWARHPALALGLATALAALIYSGMSHAFAALALNAVAAAAAATPDAASSGEAARAGLLALALSGSLLALLAFDVDDMVRSLLLDPDLELLRRAPRSPATLMAIKALDAAPRTALPLIVLAAPAASAFLAGTRAPLAGAIVATGLIATLWLTTLAGGLALSLAILRFVPAAKARDALGLVSTLVITLIWIPGALALPRALALDPAGANALAATLRAASHGSGPAAAATRSIAAAAAGRGGMALADLATVAACALLAILAVWLVARAALADVFERLAGGDVAGNPAAGRSTRRRWNYGSIMGAIVKRDARMLGRSWSLLGDLFVASALWTMIPLAGLAGGTIEWANLSRLMLLSVALGLGYEVAARSIPFEREAGHWVRVAPIRAIDYCGAKLAGSALVTGPIVLLVGTSFAIARPEAARAILESAPLLLAALLLSQATGLWAGARFGDPAWVNPRAMLRLAGRVVAAILVLLQLAAWLAAFYTLDLLAPALQTLVSTLAVVLALGLAWVPVRAAANQLRSRDWPN